ncbi:MAG: hypothetical protein M1836_007768 [Candelina mexicana]|nr:MAG: hypothetical protein M1836_007768 [Candelina mexicana]
MTTRYTDPEWVQIIQESQESLSDDKTIYQAPMIGSPEFARYIDHTMVNLDAKKEHIDILCAEARIHGFRSVCVRHHSVSRAVKNLRGTNIIVGCVIGFHEGTQTMTEKVALVLSFLSFRFTPLGVFFFYPPSLFSFLSSHIKRPYSLIPASEATQAVKDGALELDMVLNYPLLYTGEFSACYTDVAAVRATAPPPTQLRVILETPQLTQYEIIAACRIAAHSRADMLCTGTGVAPTEEGVERAGNVDVGSACPEDNVRLMRDVVRGTGIQVKASGSDVKSLGDAVRLIEAGATRLGTSHGVEMMEEARARVQGITHAAGMRMTREMAGRDGGGNLESVEEGGWLETPSPEGTRTPVRQYFSPFPSRDQRAQKSWGNI